MKFITHYLYAFVSSTWLFTLGIFNKANRKLIYQIAAHFGFHHKVQSKLPGIAADDLVPHNTIVTLTETSIRDGNITLEELSILCGIIQHKKPGNIFEFGTFDGRSTLNMALNAPANGRVTTLDLDPALPQTHFELAGHEKTYTGQPKGRRFVSSPQAHQITQLLGDTATFDFKPYHNSMNLVFIDASHSAEYVKNDTEAALLLLHNGRGTLIWHDCGVWDGVTQYLNEAHARDPRFGQLKHIENTSLAILELS